MRIIFYIFIFALLPVHSIAQAKMFTGFGVGVVMHSVGSHAMGTNSLNYTPDELHVAINTRLGLQGKKWQAGVAFETGVIKGQVGYDINVHDATGRLIYTVNTMTIEDIAAPYASPMAFGHYKLNLPNGAYMYAGPALGLFAARNSMTVDKRLSSFAGGANLGIYLKLGNNACFEVNHAWRATSLNIKGGGTSQNMPAGFGGSYAVYMSERMSLNYIASTIGLSVAL